jgi:heterodisulfide reductase subunit A
MGEEIRVGVFVCDCGSNIAGVVDVPEVVEYAKGLDHVVLADQGRWSCSVDYLALLGGMIQDNDLNRVVIASCTPRTHEPLFKRTTKEAGLNPYLLEFVSLREQVSWVHMGEPENATEKAKDLVRMGVAKAILLEEGEEIRLPVQMDCLVIGGGITGMTTALTIADQGFNAVLVEKEARLGGLLNSISLISHNGHTRPASEIVMAKVDQVEAHPNIRVLTNATIEAVEGYVGNFNVTLNVDDAVENIQASTISVNTGMQEIEPVGFYEYGDNPSVVTQLQLEGMLLRNEAEGIGDVVFINCVNSRNEVRGCCNIGCSVAIKNALMLKDRNPDSSVSILYRDLNMLKEEGHDLEKAKAAGVRFIRFPDERYPEISGENGDLKVQVYDLLLGQELSFPADLLVLTTGYQGDATSDHLKGLLKVSTNADSFFQEAHIKLGPLDFASQGIYLGGCAKHPMNLKESSEEGIGAAMRASIPMRKGFVEAEGIVASIDLSECTNCTICYKKCPYNAIQLNEDELPEVIKALCKGCGLCVADCPQDCMTIVHYTDAQILAQVEAALVENPEDKIIGYVCHWCALGGVDMAGVGRMQYPTNARLIRVMCSARVSETMIMLPFELGAAGVLVAGCEFPTCHYITGNYAAERRLRRIRKKLGRKGYDPDKLWNLWCSAADGPKFANTMREMVAELHLE